jgi:hypothetical protein
MITPPEYLEQRFLHITKLEYKPANMLVKQVLTESCAESAIKSS